MNKDLKIIKKKFGEEMMHFCRENFSTILEKEGELSKFLLDLFEPNHDLINDLKHYDILNNFKHYIYYIYNLDNEEEIREEDLKNPEELLSEAGYILYECKSEKDIQSFKKYYAKGEELCTFSGGRLDRCFVFFAVKKNVDEIKREDFKKPNRQDEYGTSVISIQFSRSESHILSIKNRYNHTVVNPDATFSNDLDNIIPGLTYSFEKYYGLVQKYSKQNKLEIPNYVMAEDGKFYKYNIETNNVYYCPNNIVICNSIVERLPKEKFILFDNFVLNLQTKEISLYLSYEKDGFINSLKDIKDIIVQSDNNEKVITIIPNIGEKIEIKLDKNNNIISYKNNNLVEVENDYLYYNRHLKNFDCPNIKIINNGFLYSNRGLISINLPKVEKIGNDFLYCNTNLQEIMLPNVKEIGKGFLSCNEQLKKLELINVKKVGYNFLHDNDILEEISLLNIIEIEHHFLYYNSKLKKIYCPNLQFIGNNCLTFNEELESLNLPNVKKIGDNFLFYNKKLKTFNAPVLEMLGEDVLFFNKKMIFKYLAYLLIKGKIMTTSNNHHIIKEIIPSRTRNK